MCPGSQKCCSVDGCTLQCVDALPAVTPITIRGDDGDPGPPGDEVSILLRDGDAYFHIILKSFVFESLNVNKKSLKNTFGFSE